MTSMHEKWKERLHWALRFGEVSELLDQLGCPPATDVGLAHLHWGPPEDHTLPACSVTTGGFPPIGAYHRLYLEAPGYEQAVENPEQLRERAPEFIRHVQKFVESQK